MSAGTSPGRSGHAPAAHSLTDPSRVVASGDDGRRLAEMAPDVGSRRPPRSIDPVAPQGFVSWRSGRARVAGSGAVWICGVVQWRSEAALLLDLLAPRRRPPLGNRHPLRTRTVRAVPPETTLDSEAQRAACAGPSARLADVAEVLVSLEERRRWRGSSPSRRARKGDHGSPPFPSGRRPEEAPYPARGPRS